MSQYPNIWSYRWFCLELNEVTDDDSVLGVETCMAGTVTGLENSNYKWICSPCLEETQKASPDSMSVANSWSLCSIRVYLMQSCCWILPQYIHYWYQIASICPHNFHTRWVPRHHDCIDTRALRSNDNVRIDLFRVNHSVPIEPLCMTWWNPQSNPVYHQNHWIFHSIILLIQSWMF